MIYGCGCNQILDLKPGVDKGEIKNGCAKGTLAAFTDGKGWAKKINK